MNELKVFNFHDVDVVDSRDVAQMVGRSHNELLKSIRTYQQYLAEGNFPHGSFFIGNSYIDNNNQERPCFLITKKGCDMIANKMPGKKGVLFTAAYVTAFEKMNGAVETTRPHRSRGISERPCQSGSHHKKGDAGYGKHTAASRLYG